MTTYYKKVTVPAYEYFTTVETESDFEVMELSKTSLKAFVWEPHTQERNGARLSFCATGNVLTFGGYHENGNSRTQWEEPPQVCIEIYDNGEAYIGKGGSIVLESIDYSGNIDIWIAAIYAEIIKYTS